MDRPIRPASRESTEQAQQITLAFLIKRYLARKGYKVGHLTPQQVCRKLEQDYKTSRVVRDGKTANEIYAEREG